MERYMKLLIDLPLDRPPYPPMATLTPNDIIEASVALWIDQYIDDDRLDSNTVEQVVDYINSRMGVSMGKCEVQELIYYYVNDIVMETYEAVECVMKRITLLSRSRPLITLVTIDFPTIVLELYQDD